MGDVTAVMMDVITDKSGHTITPMAVSVCLTPAAPSPLPIPYPVVGSSVEGLTDEAMRTKINGAKVATVGSVVKTCHGNEPGTLKEVVSLNTTGPCFIIMGAPIVLCELGMMGITLSPCISNKAPTAGAGGSASGAGGAGGGGGGGNASGSGGSGPNGPNGPANGGGGGGGSNSGAGGGGSGGGRGGGGGGGAGSSSGPADQHTCQGGHPVDLVTGAVVDKAFDLELPGRIPLAFKRFYSSLRFKDATATLGPGWAHSFEERITTAADRITLRDGEGREIWFASIAPGESTFHRRERMTLHRDTDGDYRVEDHKTRLVSHYRRVVDTGASVLRAIEDAWKNRIEFEYEDARLARVHDTAGRIVHVRWRGSRIVRLEVFIAGSCEQWVDYEYDDAGCLTAVVDALGHADEYEYDGFHRQTAATIKAGSRFQYTYDGDSGRCVRTWGPNGLYAIEMEYDAVARRTTVYGEQSRIIDWADLPGFARRESTLDGDVLEEVAYDDDGHRIAIANGAGEGYKIWFDARGNEIRRVDATNAVEAWEYDDRDLVRRHIAADGRVTEVTTDVYGAVVRVTNPEGTFTALTYDDRGRLVRAEDEGGVIAQREYDSMHNLTAEVDALGGRSVYAYDALGRRTSETNALGVSEHYTRDRMGRRVTVRRPDGTSVQYTYDPGGKVTREVAADGGVTQLSYAGMGVISKLVEPDGRTWTFAYTSEERLAKITNPLGEVYAFTYDAGGAVVEEKTFDGRVTKYRRNKARDIDRVDYPDGSYRSFEYDRMGRLVLDQGSDNSTVRFRRDLLGRVIEASLDDTGWRHTLQFERDPQGRIVLERQGDRTLRYTYDNYDNIVERALWEGSATQYAFDRLGALVGVQHGGRSFTFERDAAGREVHRRDSRGTFAMRYSYDTMDRLLEQRAVGPSAAGGVPDVLVQRQYQYDRVGRLNRVDDATWGTTRYRYDRGGSLTEASHPNDRRRSYVYNSAGSLLAALEDLSSSSKKWKVAAGNRLTETEGEAFAYDKCGRRTAKRDKTTGAVTDYSWSIRSWLREVKLPDGKLVKLHYDALGRRVRKEVVEPKVRPIISELVWDRDEPCADLTPDHGVRVFVAHPTGGAPLLQAQKGEVFMVLTDQVGVAKELIDGAGRVAWAATHDGWGQILDQKWDELGVKNRGYQVSSPFRLLGQYEEPEIGLTATRYRYFDPAVARWISPDPIGIQGGFNLNGFNGVPTADIDPLGLATGGGSGHIHTVEVSRSRHPESARHIEDAQRRGQPRVLTIDRNRRRTRERRRESTSRLDTRDGHDRDEYPPAMFREGGNRGPRGRASVRHVDSSDNRGAGSVIGQQCRGLPSGTQVRIVVVD
ncbi:MAG: DUF6531 domain-containing protein [Polyangiaceae bacterium]